MGLANYFAGALQLPYGRFLKAAQAVRYDIEVSRDSGPAKAAEQGKTPAPSNSEKKK